MPAPKVEIYSKEDCPYCVLAKDFFKRKGIPFTEIDLTDKHDEVMALKARTRFMTLPQIFINDEFVGGYTDLIAKVNSGKLKL